MSTDKHLALIQRLADLAEPGRTRWPEFADRLDRARTAVERRLSTGEPADAAVAGLASFDQEDDGTGEWQHTVDLIELLTAIVADGPVADVLAAAIQSHLDTMASVIANRRAVELGRPVRESEVEALLAGSAEWRATTAFVRDLGIGWRGYGCR